MPLAKNEQCRSYPEVYVMPLDTPPEVRDAVSRLVDATQNLVECGGITPEDAKRYPIDPHHWIIRRPLLLEVDEEYTAELEKLFDYRIKLYREASAAYNELAPIRHAV